MPKVVSPSTDFFIIFPHFLQVFLKYYSPQIISCQTLVMVAQSTHLKCLWRILPCLRTLLLRPSYIISVSLLHPLMQKLPPAPSVHPMLTQSRAKHSLNTSPHMLLTTLEPSSVHEALLDPHWTKAMQEEFTTL